MQQRHTQNHVDSVDDNEAQAAQIDSVSDLQTTKSGTNLGTKAPISNHSKPEQKNPSRRQGKYLQQQHTKKVNNPKKDAHSEEGMSRGPSCGGLPADVGLRGRDPRLRSTGGQGERPA